MIPFLLSLRLKRIGRRPITDPKIKASIRERLVQAGYLQDRSKVLWRARMILASMSILVTGCGGMASYAYASDSVLPNTPLYPVRQELEKLEIQLTFTSTTRAQVIEKQVERRKKEAHLLEKQQKPLPVLHATLLKQEREEARKQASSTRMIPLRQLRVPMSGRDRDQSQKQRNQKHEKDPRETKQDKGVRLQIQERMPLSPTSAPRDLRTRIRREALEEARLQVKTEERVLPRRVVPGVRRPSSALPRRSESKK